MADSNHINIVGYTNEDIYRVFTLKLADGVTPINITSLDFEADIADAKTGATVLRMTTSEGDNRIVKNDPTQGQFTIKIAQGEIAYIRGRSLVYDMLRKDSLGVLTRLWGGKVTITVGVTDP